MCLSCECEVTDLFEPEINVFWRRKEICFFRKIERNILWSLWCLWMCECRFDPDWSQQFFYGWKKCLILTFQFWYFWVLWLWALFQMRHSGPHSGSWLKIWACECRFDSDQTPIDFFRDLRPVCLWLEIAVLHKRWHSGQVGFRKYFFHFYFNLPNAMLSNFSCNSKRRWRWLSQHLGIILTWLQIAVVWFI